MDGEKRFTIPYNFRGVSLDNNDMIKTTFLIFFRKVFITYHLYVPQQPVEDERREKKELRGTVPNQEHCS